MSLNLYTYCENDPINSWDPSGHVTKEEGIAVHTEVEAYFLLTYQAYPSLNATAEYRIPKYLTRTETGSGRADMVLFTFNSAQVFELKPFGSKADGILQLADYVQAMNKLGITTQKGTLFNPHRKTLPHPFEPNKVVVLYTDYANNPGLILYGFRKRNPNEVTDYELLVEENTSKQTIKNSNSKIIDGLAAGSIITAGAAIIGRTIDSISKRLSPVFSLPPWMIDPKYFEKQAESGRIS